MKPSRGRTILVRVITVLLFVIMVSAGANKFYAPQDWVESFTPLGAPLWLIPVVGILEIGGAVLLFVPPFAVLAALLLAVTMLVATGVNVSAEGKIPEAVITFLLTTAAFTLARLRSNQSPGADEEAEPAAAEEEAKPAAEPEN